jgi:hypothetical protein
VLFVTHDIDEAISATRVGMSARPGAPNATLRSIRARHGCAHGLEPDAVRRALALLTDKDRDEAVHALEPRPGQVMRPVAAQGRAVALAPVAAQ